MVSTLIVLGLVALGVGIVAFATRRPPARPVRAADLTKVRAAPPPAEPTPYDPFAHAPFPASAHHEQTSTERA